MVCGTHAIPTPRSSQYEPSFEPYRNPESFYVKKIFVKDSEEFYKGFDENVRRECGKNEEKSDKIHMIRFAAMK